MLKEFKEFIARGNVIDLAVGMIIGSAFGKIVSSFVDDIISPLIGLLTGASDLSALVWVLKPERVVDGETVEATIVNFGAFIQSGIDFLIIAFAIFLVIKAINKFKKKKEEEEKAADPGPSEKDLLKEIVKELKESKGR